MEVEALANVDWPVAVNAVAVVVAKVEVPVTLRVPERERLGPLRLFTVSDEIVVVARVEVPVTVSKPARDVLPVINAFPETLKAEVEADPKDVCPETVNVVAVVEARVEIPETVRVPDNVDAPVTYWLPDTVKAVVDAEARAVWPTTNKLLAMDWFVEEELPKTDCPVTYKLPLRLSLVPEALVNESPCKFVNPEIVNAVAEALLRVAWPVAVIEFREAEPFT